MSKVSKIPYKKIFRVPAGRELGSERQFRMEIAKFFTFKLRSIENSGRDRGLQGCGRWMNRDEKFILELGAIPSYCVCKQEAGFRCAHHCTVMVWLGGISITILCMVAQPR